MEVYVLTCNNLPLGVYSTRELADKASATFVAHPTGDELVTDEPRLFNIKAATVDDEPRDLLGEIISDESEAQVLNDLNNAVGRLNDYLDSTTRFSKVQLLELLAQVHGDLASAAAAL